MKIRHWYDFAYGSTKIVFYEDSENNTISILHNPYTHETFRLEKSKEIPKEFIASFPMPFSEFLSALIKDMDAEQIKTNGEMRNEGLLKATQYHLEDMRKLVFNKGEIK